MGEMISSWRRALPVGLCTDGVAAWDSSNIWILVLSAFGYRLECLLYNGLRRKAHLLREEDAAWAKQRLLNAMFGLGAVLRRAIADDALLYGPPSMQVHRSLHARSLITSLTPRFVSCSLTTTPSPQNCVHHTVSSIPDRSRPKPRLQSGAATGFKGGDSRSRLVPPRGGCYVAKCKMGVEGV